jgi:hypothetical protein
VRPRRAGVWPRLAIGFLRRAAERFGGSPERNYSVRPRQSPWRRMASGERQSKALEMFHVKHFHVNPCVRAPPRIHECERQRGPVSSRKRLSRSAGTIRRLPGPRRFGPESCSRSSPDRIEDRRSSQARDGGANRRESFAVGTGRGRAVPSAEKSQARSQAALVAPKSGLFAAAVVANYWHRPIEQPPGVRPGDVSRETLPTHHGLLSGLGEGERRRGGVQPGSGLSAGWPDDSAPAARRLGSQARDPAHH